MNVNVVLDLTPKEAMLVQTGEANLLGLLKDANNNRVISHVPLTSSAKNNNTAKGVWIGVGITAAISVATALTVAIVKHKQRKKQAEKTPSSALSLEHNRTMISYVDKAQRGFLSLKDVNRLADFFDALVKNCDGSDIKIELSEDEINTLYGIIYKFSKEFCGKKNIQFDKKYLLLEEIEEKTDKETIEVVRDLPFL